MTSSDYISNEFRNQERVVNQIEQQNVHGNLNIQQLILIEFLIHDTILTKSSRIDKVSSNESLNLLNLLPNCPQAAFNAYERRHDTTCLQGTRKDILNQIETWADECDDKCIFWLNEIIETRKSTIARTIARRYHEEDRLETSFFFSKDQQDLRHASKLFSSIATQLVKQFAILKKHNCETVMKHRDIAQQTLHDQWTQLIFHPIASSKPPPSRPLWWLWSMPWTSVKTRKMYEKWYSSSRKSKAWKRVDWESLWSIDKKLRSVLTSSRSWRTATATLCCTTFRRRWSTRISWPSIDTSSKTLTFLSPGRASQMWIIS